MLSWIFKYFSLVLYDLHSGRSNWRQRAKMGSQFFYHWKLKICYTYAQQNTSITNYIHDKPPRMFRKVQYNEWITFPENRPLAFTLGIIHHSFSKYAIFSKKLTFLTLWYAHVRNVRGRGRELVFRKILCT